MRTLVFAKRNALEIIRDPLNVFFGLAFPVLLLVILMAIFKNVPGAPIGVNELAPGIAVFGLSFLSLFGGMTLSKDRSSAFLERLYTTPLRAYEMIIAYVLPLVAFAIVQCIVCYIISMIFGIEVTPNILLAILAIVPISLFYIALGLLFGSFMNEKAIGGAVGSILPVATAILGGCWLDLDILGEGMKTFAYILPFANAVDLEKSLMLGTFEGAGINLLWVLGYTIVTFVGAILLFYRQMQK